ncbi:MAG TPA: class I SAM-dependent methyltransferase [Polyangia bacterium]|nr:class I SAM-dependent methyltransferase [Polyangia bacterium]
MTSEADTATAAYAARLERLETVWWKRWLDVQRPYRWHLRSLNLGPTLDVGCGRGRNLANLGSRPGDVGVDHNPDSVAAARARGLEAYVVDAFRASPKAQPGAFGALLVSHVIEHMPPVDAERLLADYLPYVRPGGQVVLITPQEAGYRSDATHVTFTDLDALARLVTSQGLEVTRRYSFPLPRPIGRVFKYNEFVLLARVPERAPT